MPALWQSSQRPMYVRTVWVGEFRHAILTHDDPYLLKLHATRRRPNSSASCATKYQSSRLSHRPDDRMRNFNFVITNDKSSFNRRPRTTHEIERLDLHDVDQESEADLVIKASPQTLNESNSSFDINMKNLRANKTARNEKDTELSDRVLQWLDLAGKIDLLAPENVARMNQPRHSWPELKRGYNLSKSKTAFDVRKEGAKISPKSGESPKAQLNGPSIDRHDFYVPTSANTIEEYARQSRNAKVTPRDARNHPKLKPKECKSNVVETRQKVMSERSAVEKQYADMLSRKLIPDVSKNPKRQVHIFMPDLPKKTDSIVTSRTESLLSTTSYKSLKQ